MSDPSIASRDRVHVEDNRMELSSIRDALPDSNLSSGVGTTSTGSGAAQLDTLRLALSARSALVALVPESCLVEPSPPVSVDGAATICGLGATQASSGRSGESDFSLVAPVEFDKGGRLQRAWSLMRPGEGVRWMTAGLGRANDSSLSPTATALHPRPV